MPNGFAGWAGIPLVGLRMDFKIALKTSTVSCPQLDGVLTREEVTRER
jgi:hypothetical protein